MSQNPSFPECFKALVDRICAREGLTRGVLAKDLGVHIQSLSNAAYRGEIGFDLICRIARRADASPEELHQIEQAWLDMRTLRPILREMIQRATHENGTP